MEKEVKGTEKEIEQIRETVEQFEETQQRLKEESATKPSKIMNCIAIYHQSALLSITT